MTKAAPTAAARLRRSAILCLQSACCLLLLCGHLGSASAGGGAASCQQGCPLKYDPVCGADGSLYWNGCLASCQGVELAPDADLGSCAQYGGAAGLNVTTAVDSVATVVTPRLLRRYSRHGFKYAGRVRLASAAAAAAGAAADPALGLLPDPARPFADGIPYDPAAALTPAQELSANVRVLRITRDGDLYTAKYAVRDALPALAPACARLKKKKQKRAAACALAAQLATEPQLQAEMRPIEPFEAPASVPQSSNTSAAAPPQPSSSFGAASSPQPPLSRRLRLRALQAAAVTRHRHELQALRRALLQHGNVSSSSSSGGRDDADADALQRRRLADWGIIGNDDRADCPAKQYPYTAAGQLTMGDTDGSASGPRPFLCSAALIGPDVILTAAHCVFDRNTRAFYRDVLFAPGRYRLAATGSVSPFGAASWLDITIYSDFTSRPPDGAYPAQVLPWDVALIRLDRSVGLQAGWLGLRATCGSDEGGTGGSVSVTSAGYPSDYNYGACVTSGCTMSGECGKREWRHTCDTAQGQSGSPLWAQLPVAPGARKKGPFIRGLVIASTRTQNVALALTPFHAANVLFWARARGSLA